MPRHHQLLPPPETVHWGFFDSALQPVLTIDSGDTVEIDTVSGGRQEVGDISHFRPDHRLIAETVPQGPGPHILTGPIGVRGAEPGDTLEVRIQSIELTEKIFPISVAALFRSIVRRCWPDCLGGWMFLCGHFSELLAFRHRLITAVSPASSLGNMVATSTTKNSLWVRRCFCRYLYRRRNSQSGMAMRCKAMARSVSPRWRPA